MSIFSFIYEIRDTATNSYIKDVVVQNCESTDIQKYNVLGKWFKSENGEPLPQIKSNDNSLIAILKSVNKKNNI